MKNLFLALIALIMIQPAAKAIDTNNMENVKDLKTLLFGEDAKLGAHIQQIGKTSDGDKCQLDIYYTRYAVSVSAHTVSPDYKLSGSFWASVSAKTSGQYQILDSDEGLLELSQIAYSMDERGNYADKQYLKIETLNRAGEEKINNVVSVQLKNQKTSLWRKLDPKKDRLLPDFSNSEKTSIDCFFK